MSSLVAVDLILELLLSLLDVPVQPVEVMQVRELIFPVHLFVYGFLLLHQLDVPLLEAHLKP
jgi:hypothetical protein